MFWTFWMQWTGMISNGNFTDTCSVLTNHLVFFSVTAETVQKRQRWRGFWLWSDGTGSIHWENHCQHEVGQREQAECSGLVHSSSKSLIRHWTIFFTNFFFLEPNLDMGNLYSLKKIFSSPLFCKLHWRRVKAKVYPCVTIYYSVGGWSQSQLSQDKGIWTLYVSRKIIKCLAPLMQHKSGMWKTCEMRNQ